MGRGEAWRASGPTGREEACEPDCPAGTSLVSSPVAGPSPGVRALTAWFTKSQLPGPQAKVTVQVHLICLPQNQIAFRLKFPFNFLREMDAYSTQGKLLQFSSGFPSCLPSLGEGSQSQGIWDAPGGHQSCILAPSQGMLLCPPKPAFSCR